MNLKIYGSTIVFVCFFSFAIGYEIGHPVQAQQRPNDACSMAQENANSLYAQMNKEEGDCMKAVDQLDDSLQQSGYPVSKSDKFDCKTRIGQISLAVWQSGWKGADWRPALDNTWTVLYEPSPSPLVLSFSLSQLLTRAGLLPSFSVPIGGGAATPRWIIPGKLPPIALTNGLSFMSHEASPGTEVPTRDVGPFPARTLQ